MFPNNGPVHPRAPLQKGRQMMRPRDDEDGGGSKLSYKNNVTHR